MTTPHHTTPRHLQLLRWLSQHVKHYEVMTVSGYRAPLAITGVTAVTDALRAECAACDAAYNRHGALVTAHGDLASAVSTVRFYAPNERSRPFPEVCLSVRVRYVVVVHRSLSAGFVCLQVLAVHPYDVNRVQRQVQGVLQRDKGNLDEAGRLLTYLGNLGQEQEAEEDDADCLICCCPKSKHLGVLPCGHSYWYAHVPPGRYCRVCNSQY